MTKIQNPIECPYCAVQLKAVQTEKGFFYVCPRCEPVKMAIGESRKRANKKGGYKRDPYEQAAIKTKIYYYI